MRCLTLARRLKQRGAQVLFVTRAHRGNGRGLIEQAGFPCRVLPGATSPLDSNDSDGWLGVPELEDAAQTRHEIDAVGGAEWVVVDHYGIDAAWESALRRGGRRVFAIDDLANRPHDCDGLLDQNLYSDMDRRYADLVPAGCRKFLGPRFALLREEFIETRASLRPRDGSVNRILVFFGGADAPNVTGRAISALKSFNRPRIAVDVVVGAANPHRAEVESAASGLANATFHFQVDRMAPLMAAADLAIGGGGTATWERCFLGLPCLTVVMAENQREMTGSVAARGAVWSLGNAEHATAESIGAALETLVDNQKKVKSMGVAALSIMGDGRDSGIEDLLMEGARA